jgi:hypothetical protein
MWLSMSDTSEVNPSERLDEHLLGTILSTKCSPHLSADSYWEEVIERLRTRVRITLRCEHDGSAVLIGVFNRPHRTRTANR